MLLLCSHEKLSQKTVHEVYDSHEHSSISEQLRLSKFLMNVLVLVSKICSRSDGTAAFETEQNIIRFVQKVKQIPTGDGFNLARVL